MNEAKIIPLTFDEYEPFPGLAKDDAGARLVSVCASEINIEPVEWLWPGRLAVGKHTCIAGEPGASKSQLTMDISAIISTAGSWPCGEGNSPHGSVVLLSAEDGAADTIIPRRHAAGADLGRVHIVSAVREGKGRRAFNLQIDLALLEQEVKRIGDVLLVIIDPVSSYMGKTDSHKNAEVRGVLEPVGEFAERMRVAILSVTHFSKAGAGTTTKALHRFIGSIAFVGAPRIALAVIEDSDNDRRLLLHAKNNLAPPPLGLAYRIKEKIVGEPGRAVTAPFVVWDHEHVRVTANEALAADATTGGDSTASAEAEDFLRDLLAAGPVPAKQIRADVEAAALSWSTVKRAKARLGIKADKAGMDAGWSWSLPRRGPRSPEEDHVLNMSPFVPDEPLRDQDAGDIPTFLDRRLNQGNLIASLKDESLRLKAKGLIDPPNDAA
jgi:putative DNA primase/helicase